MIAPLAPRPQYIEETDSRQFYRVDGSSNKMKDLTRIFEEILTPLYGSQSDALQKIAAAKDRVCHMLYQGNLPLGLIVFKTILSNEFEDAGIDQSIEIKSLFLVNSDANSGRGIGSLLLNKVIDEANKLRLGHKFFHVTVSETKQESLNFFRKKGFRIAREWIGRYKNGVKEYLLSCPSHLIAGQENVPPGKDGTDLVRKAAEMRVSEPISKAFTAKVLKLVSNAHWDDIHALKKLSDGTFISGSKDNTICKWNFNGDLVKTVQEVEPLAVDSRDWITAVGVINDKYWISGERNGHVYLWKTSGEYVKELHLKRPINGQHISQQENARRVTCLVPGTDKDNPAFFAGFPTLFDEFSLIEGKTIASEGLHKNDWVYCIHPLDSNTIITAVGGTLGLQKKSDDQWKKAGLLIKEERTPKGMQRPFISALSPVESSPHLLSMSVFGGYVKVLDYQKGQVVHEWKEHEKRVWNVESVANQVFASCAEDKTIKFWDIREKKSVHTISSEIGQTHTLLSLPNNILAAGHHLENSPAKNEGATLAFYDLRA